MEKYRIIEKCSSIFLSLKTKGYIATKEYINTANEKLLRNERFSLENQKREKE